MFLQDIFDTMANMIRDYINKKLENYLSLDKEEKNLLLEMLVCEFCSEQDILKVYNSDNFSKNGNLYKWVCAFGSDRLIREMASGLKVDILGAINASIVNYNRETFLYLLEKYPDVVLKDKFFCQAITRALGYQEIGIISIYLSNLEKIKDLQECNIQKCLAYESSFNSLTDKDKANIEKYYISRDIAPHTTSDKRQNMVNAVLKI